MGNYPDHETYRKLYAKYYNGRDIEELLQLVGHINGSQALDLCCGDGRIALLMLQRGALNVTAVDEAVAMVPAGLGKKNEHLQVLYKSVASALRELREDGKYFDRVICRQAVNYWLTGITAESLATVMFSGGIFVFNTFNECPSERPRTKEYNYEGHQFTEVSWCIRGIVHHVQIRDGMAPHQTSFWWISPEEYRNLLEPYFNVTEARIGRTSLYQCVRQ